MKEKLYALFTALLLLGLFPEAWAAADASIKNNYNQLQEAYENTNIIPSKRNSSAKSLYLKNFRPILTNSNLKELDAKDLEYIFQATSIANFYDPDIKYVDDMNKVSEHLRLKGLIKKRHLVDLQNAYISTRQFESARSMVNKKNLDYLKIIPKAHRAENLALKQPTIWEIEKSSLKERAFSIPQQGPFIIVVSNPLCGFCIAAAKYISGDKELENIFAEHSYWLTEPRGALYFEHFQRWSQNYSKFPVGLIGITPPWPGLGNTGTPTFYFFSDGKLIQSLRGWPRDKEDTVLDAPLAAIGLKNVKTTSSLSKE
ncbi:hypothetical protein, partial [Microbulbifer sp. 2205BS26-8]|uniref:hypothetical protein n=1 Tax=Microbulbifer sp. 2205BS26-8 TaxID=3064386 RepID=UPI00273F01B4